MFQHLFAWVFGIPASDERENAFQNATLGLDSGDAVQRLRDGVQHNTEKAGALLAGEGLFIVADTFALDHDWPRIPVLISLVCLVLGAFLVMSILRSTMRMYRHPIAGANPARLVYHLLLSRMIRFNLALYLTFASVLLLGIAAASLV
ncbi:MAG TPA: hypothetical protein VG309_02175 [Rhizomicrobium sp.]|jgi:hypothetical protein|nr:hypothetical protein [Rhizomicrobium sp.]